MRSNKSIALVTGANKGIGFETARQLAFIAGFVYLGCRDKWKGIAAVDRLKEAGMENVGFIQLDITDAGSISMSRQILEEKHGRLDILINNAAIGGKMPQQASTMDPVELKSVFETNFFGTVAVTREMLPLLRLSPAPRIVNVSSELGSLSWNAASGVDYFSTHLMAYSCSKTALNAFTVMLANELKHTPFKINSVTPSFTATDLTGNGKGQSPQQAAEVIVRYATLDEHAPSGRFFRYEKEMPW
jgi:NAD(P)-dependent dehydrogenase (short-subunit alcohol dehydrogenase family)